MMSTLIIYLHAYFGIFIVLARWNNSLRVDMSLHSDTLIWFRANQSLLLLIKAANTNVIVFGFTWLGF